MDFVTELRKCFESVNLVKDASLCGISINVDLKELNTSLIDLVRKCKRSSGFFSNRNALTLSHIVHSRNFRNWVPYLVLFAYKDWYFSQTYRSPPGTLELLMDYVVPSLKDMNLDAFLCEATIYGSGKHYHVWFGQPTYFDKYLPRSIIESPTRFGRAKYWSVVGVLDERPDMLMIQSLAEPELASDIMQHMIISGDRRYPSTISQFAVSKYVLTKAVDLWDWYFERNFLAAAAKELGFEDVKSLLSNAQSLDGFAKFESDLKIAAFEQKVKSKAGKYLSILIAPGEVELRVDNDIKTLCEEAKSVGAPEHIISVLASIKIIYGE